LGLQFQIVGTKFQSTICRYDNYFPGYLVKSDCKFEVCISSNILIRAEVTFKLDGYSEYIFDAVPVDQTWDSHNSSRSEFSVNLPKNFYCRFSTQLSKDYSATTDQTLSVEIKVFEGCTAPPFEQKFRVFPESSYRRDVKTIKQQLGVGHTKVTKRQTNSNNNFIS